MNKLMYLGAIACCALSLTGCCDDDIVQSPQGQGKLSVRFDVDATVLASSATQGSRAYADNGVVTVQDLAIALTSADGKYAKTWESVDAFQAEPTFPVGAYTIEATFGAPDSQGFDAPYFYGAADVKVTQNATAAVTLTAALANSMFTIEYTDAVKSFLASYSAELQSAGATAAIEYAADETRPAYMPAGSVDVYVNVEKASGVKARLLAATIEAEPRHHYTITVDIANGAGTGQLVVTFDDALDTEDYIVDLSDELLNMPAPTVACGGFADGEPVAIVEGYAATAPLTYTVVARGKLGKLKLVTTNGAAIDAAWPAEIDLLGASADRQAYLTGMGLRTRGVWSNPDKMAVVDLQGVLGHISVGAGQDDVRVDFTLVAVDSYGKASEEAPVLSVVGRPETLAIELIPDNDLMLGAEEYDIVLRTNCPTPDASITFQYKNARGTWTQMAGAAIQPAGDGTYTATLPVDASSSYTVRATNAAKGLYSNELAMRRIASHTYAIDRVNAWAKSAYISVVETEGDKAGLSYADYATVYLAAEGGDYAAVDATVADGCLLISGLEPGTRYSVKASLSDDINETCEPASFTTETEAQLPNGDMEQGWTRQDGLTGYWWIDSAPDGWATLNELTTSEGGSGTSASDRTGASYCAYSGTQPTTDAYSGSTAAYIATVGWGAGNHPYTSRSGFIVYTYSNAMCEHVTAGELYLGSYDADSQSGDYGYAFASRPAQLTFYYKYTAKNAADKGYAMVRVLDADGNVIGAGEANLGAAATYTAATVDIAYATPAKAGAAASIQVLFRSSFDPEKYCVFTSANSNTSTGSDPNLSYPAYNNTTNGRFTGSQLYIDEISLKY